MWDIATGEAVHTLRGHTDVVTAVILLPEGRQAISASADHTLKVWNLTTGEVVHTLRGHTDEIKDIFARPDGQQVVSVSRDHTLKVWDLIHNEEITSFSAEGPLWTCVMTPDGEICVAGELAGRVHILCLERGEHRGQKGLAPP